MRDGAQKYFCIDLDSLLLNISCCVVVKIDEILRFSEFEIQCVEIRREELRVGRRDVSYKIILERQ